MDAERVAGDQGARRVPGRGVVAVSDVEGHAGDAGDRHGRSVAQCLTGVDSGLQDGRDLVVTAPPRQQLRVPVDLPLRRGGAEGGPHLVAVDEEQVGGRQVAQDRGLHRLAVEDRVEIP